MKHFCITARYNRFHYGTDAAGISQTTLRIPKSTIEAKDFRCRLASTKLASMPRTCQ